MQITEPTTVWTIHVSISNLMVAQLLLRGFTYNKIENINDISDMQH